MFFSQTQDILYAGVFLAFSLNNIHLVFFMSFVTCAIFFNGYMFQQPLYLCYK